MQAQIKATVGVNFKFYRRNRLLLATFFLVLLVIGLSTIPSFFFLTNSQHLSIITKVSSQLSGIATIITPVLGLILISHHLGNRSAKMVFTKPCPPEAWLLASSLSAAAVAAVFYAEIFVICSFLFVAWGIPFQWGLVYVLLNDLAHALIWLGYLSFLAVVFHPVVAVLAVLIFQEGTFYGLKLLLTSCIKAAGAAHYAVFLHGAKWVVSALYLLVPVTSPFEEKNGQVYKTLRGTDADWPALLATWGYALAVSGLFFLLANFFLKRKRLI